MTLVDYVSCSSCGYEAFDARIKYIRSVANEDVYRCPLCQEETMDIQNDFESYFDE